MVPNAIYLYSTTRQKLRALDHSDGCDTSAHSDNLRITFTWGTTHMTGAGYMKAYSWQSSGLASAKGVVDHAEPRPVGLLPHHVGGLTAHVDGAAIGPGAG